MPTFPVEETHMPAAAGAFADRLLPLLLTADTLGAWELLTYLEPDERREARAWVEKQRGDLDRLDVQFAGTSDQRFDARHEGFWILALCAIKLLPPVAAARAVPWSGLWANWSYAGEAIFVQELWDADRDWVAPFVDATSTLKLQGWAENGLGTLTRVMRAVVIKHQLPCPSGQAYLANWLSGTPGDTIVECLTDNPLMPDLLLHFLALGESGSYLSLPEDVATLVATGQLDRDLILDHALTLLGTAQRPASQRVLARITTELKLTPAEIPGGLNYLLGILATGHGTAMGFLLPQAIELVGSAEDLNELAILIASRPEKKNKQVLLRALTELSDRLGSEAAIQAAELIGDSDDTALTKQVNKMITRLGGAAVVAPTPSVTGLWAMTPLAPTTRHQLTDWEKSDWLTVLDAWAPFGTVSDTAFADAIDRTLIEMAEGRFTGEELVGAVTALRDDSHLAINQIARVFSDIFLAGGLRQGWPIALEVADLCCAHSSRPPTVANLLRTLNTFAAEVPSQTLPPSLRELAAAQGETKMQLEARALGAQLAGQPIDDYLAGLRAESTTPRAPRPTPRGLWQLTAEVPPLPGEIRTAKPLVPLAELAEALSGDFTYSCQDDSDCWVPMEGYERRRSDADLTKPDHLLAATVDAIHRHGPHPTRHALSKINRWLPSNNAMFPEPRHIQPLSIVLAIDLWVGNQLCVRNLDEIAHHSVPYRTYADELWRRAADNSTRLSTSQLSELVETTRPTLQNQRVASAELPLVLPVELDRHPATLSFLRAAESLLLAEGNPVVLCSPTWGDGTLDLDDLMLRLRAANGLVTSTLDLLQALWRLRECDPARIADLDGLSLPLSSGYSWADGTPVHDGVDLVRAWVGAGGLPPLEVFEIDDHWTTPTKAPVPWEGAELLPTALRNDPWHWTWGVDSLRVMPRWPDRMIADRSNTYWNGDTPVRAAGLPGLAIHSRMSWESYVDITRRQLMNPELMATNAVNRHRTKSLQLGDFTKTLRQLFETPGCFANSWDSALRMASALSAEERKPSELVQLLRLLNEYVDEVPQPSVPTQLAHFAAANGTTKARVEARTLVAAMSR
jgi:hypothetical protein